MELAHHYTVFGVLLLIMSLCHGFIRALPITPSIVYLIFGILIGEHGLGLISLSPSKNSHAIELITEISVIVALFTVGLKLKVPFRDRKWVLPLTLATLTMIATIGAIAFLGHSFFGLSWGEGVLLGAVLSPTDPVLASEVQLEGPRDHDPIKFTLTSEGGMNDGAAFPFVMLGLGLVGAQGESWTLPMWFGKDLLWAIFVGIGVGILTGFVTSKLANFVKFSRQSYYMEDFLTISSIAISYGVALLLSSYGFLAVFANALFIRHAEYRLRKGVGKDREFPDDVLTFNEQLERIFEVIAVVTVGSLLDPATFKWQYLVFSILVLCVVRPLAVLTTILGQKTNFLSKFFFCWFGIRGIGSLYYISYAGNHGLSSQVFEELLNLTLWTVTLSILWYGITVKPLMKIRRRAIPRLSPAKEAR